MTNKINGFSADFALAKKEGTRIIVAYEKTDIDGTALAMWFEVYFHQSVPTLQQVKDAIFADINSQTDEEILCGFDYTIVVICQKISIFASALTTRYRSATSTSWL